MKKGKWVIVLALVLLLGLGTTVYAASGSSTSSRRLGLARITGLRGFDYVISVLENKLGLTEEEISAARSSGKTLYDLALEKGLTAEQFKTALYDERAKAVDEAVEKGIITKEQGEALKANLKLNMNNCTGNFDQRCGNGFGMGRGRGNGIMGNGQQSANCPFYSKTN